MSPQETSAFLRRKDFYRRILLVPLGTAEAEAAIKALVEEAEYWDQNFYCNHCWKYHKEGEGC